MSYLIERKVKKAKQVFLIFLVAILFVMFSTSCKKEKKDKNKQETIIYAQVEVRAVYYYNKYKGNVADEGSKVVLLKVVDQKVDEEIAKKIRKAIEFPKIYYEENEEQYANYGLYMVKVDSKGDYILNHIPNDRYTLYIHTAHVDYFGTIKGAYKYNKNGVDYQIPFTEEQTKFYGFDTDLDTSWITTSNYSTKQINVIGTSYNCGETDFGMCYTGVGAINPW